jgi:hypothetical protein
MRGAVEIVRSRLRDDVDEAGHGAAELGVRSVGDDDHLFHGIEVERKRRPLTAALLAEERIVEVRTIDRDVVRDAFLAVDRQLVTVGALHDGDAGGHLGELEEVAAVVRQAFDCFLVDARSPFCPRRLDQRWRRSDDDLLGGRGLLQRDWHGQRLADAEVDTLLHHRREALEHGRELVGPDWQKHRAEAAGRIGDDDDLVAGGRVPDGDGDAGNRTAGSIDDRPFDDAGRSLGLGEKRKSAQQDKEGREHEEQTTHTGLLFRSRGRR